jgi:membrane protein
MQMTVEARPRPSRLERIKGNRFVSLVLAVTKRYGEDSGSYLAAAITYYGFLSLFPMILLALALIGFALAGSESAQVEWGQRLSRSLPGLEPLIGRNLKVIVSGRAASGIIGLAGLLWTGTGAIEATGHALRVIFRRPKGKTGIVRAKLWAVAATMGLGLLALIGTVLAAGAAGVRAGGFAGYLLRIVAGLVGFAIDFTLFVVTYRVLTRGWGPRFAQLWKGALVGAAGWTLLKLFGAWYAVRSASNAGAVYGTFASVVGILLVLYLSSQLFLYGAELNAVIMKGGTMKKKEEDDERAATQLDGDKAPDEVSTPQLVRSIAGDSAMLVQKELELARLEIVEAVTARLKAAAAIGGAAVVGLIALVFLGITAASALDLVLTAWVSRLVVAGGFLLLALLAVAFALPRFRKPSLAPEKTKETVKEDVEWAKDQLKRSKR